MSVLRRLSIDRADPHRLSTLAAVYADQLAARAYATEVVARRERTLIRFAAWCAERGITHARGLDRAAVEAYARALPRIRDVRGQPLSVHAQARRLAGVRSFGAWLERSRMVAVNPAAAVPLPARPAHPPRVVLTRRQIDWLLSVPRIDEPDGLRDRAVLETLYSTGVRRSELCGMTLADVPPGQGFARVRQGKGGRERMVPIGARALSWIATYLREARPVLADRGRNPSDALWLHDDGGTLTPAALYVLVRRTFDAIGIGRVGACHLLRHAMATHLLEAGANVEAIGAMLGHADLRTTPIYTRVTADSLAAHLGAVRAKLGLRAPAATAAGPAP